MALEAYIPIWEGSSRFIQKEPGARGTRLHRLWGGLTLLAIAEWESSEARTRAFQTIARKYPKNHIARVNDSQYGKVFVVGNADELTTVFPLRNNKRRAR